MKSRIFFGLVGAAAIGLWPAGPALRAATAVNPDLTTATAVERVRELLVDSNSQPSSLTAPLPAIILRADGTINYLCAASGQQFLASRTVAAAPETTARQFLEAHADALGVSPAVVSNLTTLRVQHVNGRDYVKFQQMLDGVRVLGGQVLIQLNAAGGVEYLANRLARNLAALGGSTGLDANTAAARGQELVSRAFPTFQLTNGAPELVQFVPELMGLAGNARRAWRVQVLARNLILPNLDLLLDAETGELLFQYSRSCTAVFRSIFDANNNVAWPPQFPTPPPLPTRIESGPASSVGDANNAYDFIGDAYNFYLNQHNRHGLSGSDQPVFAVVRVCVGGESCPWANATFSNLPDPPFTGIPGQTINEGIISVGDGWAQDDVLAHEYTHGVTSFESGLIYANASGAINEAFSDIWGEFVDWGNGRGNDTALARWDVGEDLSGGRIRSMRDPTVKNNPDRLGSTLVTAPTGGPNLDNDYGGVHSNSGIVNKLCYLLTDGASFNGYTITGLGMNQVVNLFYEVNTHLLPGTADYTDLSISLHQAAANLGWSATDTANLHRACLAVQIVGNYVDRGNGNASPNGCLQAGTGAGGPFPQVAQGAAAVSAGDTLFIRGASSTHYNERLRLNKPMTLRAYNGTAVIGRP